MTPMHKRFSSIIGNMNYDVEVVYSVGLKYNKNFEKGGSVFSKIPS